jgi:hypothetical protein
MLLASAAMGDCTTDGHGDMSERDKHVLMMESAYFLCNILKPPYTL